MAEFVIEHDVLIKAKNIWEEEVLIPEQVRTIGENAFKSCIHLKKIKIPVSVDILEMEAFSYCKNLELVELPESIMKVGAKAFFCCKNLKEVRIYPVPKTQESENEKEKKKSFWERIRDFFFRKQPPKTEKRVLVEREAFSLCKSLEKIELPAELKVIEVEVFRKCTGLRKITLPNQVTDIDKQAFGDCENLVEIHFPANLKRIGNRAFSNCKSLKKIEIEDAPIELGAYAFGGCSGLKEIKLPVCTQRICGSLIDNDVPDISKIYFWENHQIKYVLPVNMRYYGDCMPVVQRYDECFPYRTQFSFGDHAIEIEGAFLRLQNQSKMKEVFVKYLKDNAKESIEFCIEQNKIEFLEICGEIALLNQENIFDYILYTNQKGRVEISAFLMNYQREHFPNSGDSSLDLEDL